ncbi:MAG: 50S ribosomal protein L9 [Parcubacteria group bacterium]
MKVIFLKNIIGTAKKYDVKDVKEGFARNHLLPHGIAVAATPEQMRFIKLQRESIASASSDVEATARSLSKKFEGHTLTMKVKANDRGHLYAGVSAKEISKQISKQFNVLIGDTSIHILEPIRSIGEHTISLTVGTIKMPLLILIEPIT